MSNIFSRVRGNSYILQIATLMSGTLIAQVVSLLFIPIMTRLYTPSEFGVYSLFFSITTLLGMVSSLKYEQAIILPKSDRDAEALLFLSLIITFSISLFIALFITIFYDFLVGYFQKLSFVLWLMPISILIIGLLQIFTTYSNRKQIYKKMATAQVTNSITTATIQSSSRYFFKLDGLIVGKILGDLSALLVLLQYHISNQTMNLKSISKRRVLVNIKRYDNFPKYQSLIVFLNALSQSVPLLMLLSLYSAEVAGLYALTARILHAPISLVGGSTREVYYQKASKMYANGQNIYNLYIKTTLGLLKLSIVPFFIVLIFGQDIFVFIFGQKWEASGLIAQISVFWFLYSFINPPAVVSYNILGLQKVQFKIQVILLILRVLAIYIGYYFWGSYLASVVAYTVVGATLNTFSMLYIGSKIKEKKEKK